MSIKLSTEAVNRLGFRVLTNGLNLENFKKNPIMLLEHGKHYPYPIGKWENLRVENGDLIGDPVFDENDQYGKLAKSKYEQGFMNTASLGIITQEVSDSPELLLPGQYRATVTKADVYEITLAISPVNQEAVRLSMDKDQTMDEILPKLQTMNLQKIATTLSLPQDADETAIINKINKLTQTAAQFQTERINNLLSLGVEKGIVNDKNKASWQKLAEQDFDSTKLAFDTVEMPEKEVKKEEKKDELSVQQLIKMAQNSGGGQTVDMTNKENWSFDDWQKNDESGLLSMKRNDPDKYKELALAYEPK